MRRLQAVLFDLDGLLIDSEPLWTAVETEFAARHGTVWTHDIKQAIVGARLDVAVPTMLQMFGTPSARSCDPRLETAWVSERIVARFREGVVLKPGAAELLAALSTAGVPAALVSSSVRALVEAALDSIGRRWFVATVAGDDVARPKPHPEPYLSAARAPAVDPARCVVLEDSATGVAAGEAAGCAVIAVPEVAPIRPAPPRRSVVGSLRDLDLSRLAQVLA